jgi:hypothetical protein
MFGPNETIEAVIKNVNRDEDLPPAMVEYFLKVFNKINVNVVPKVGEVYKIPFVDRGK